METTIEIGPMRSGEADALYALTKRVAEKLVEKDFDPEGKSEFYGALDLILNQKPENHLLLVARTADRPVGFIDIRSRFHICLFFVDIGFHGQGIGRKLFEAALEKCMIGDNPTSMEVNSSLYAVPIYEALGFKKRGGVQLLNGIRFMEMDFSQKK